MQELQIPNGYFQLWEYVPDTAGHSFFIISMF